jgi:hypothetical protein
MDRASTAAAQTTLPECALAESVVAAPADVGHHGQLILTAGIVTGLLLAVGLLTGCAADADNRGPAVAGCGVTIPNRSKPPGERSGSGHHGNGRLWTALPVDGKMVVTNKRPAPPGTTAGALHRDGSLSVKWPWWGIRSAGPRLIVTGKKQDAARARTLARISHRRTRYFWASVLQLPSQGCWHVTARARNARLSFVIAVSVR